MQSPQPPGGPSSAKNMPKTLSAEDQAYLDEVQKRAIWQMGGPTLAAGAAAFFLTRRHPKRWLRVAAVSSSTLAGALGGFLWTSASSLERIDKLSNESVFKKLANQVLVQRYPMAVADAMDERKKQQQQQKQ